jgi:hypothetical protein
VNKLLKIVIGIVVFFVLAVAAIFYYTSGLTKTADAFFDSIKKQDIATAHQYLSEDFKASTDEASLKDFLTKGALLKFKNTSWSSRQVSGGRGELDGEVIPETGGVVPLKLIFIKEKEQWKIYGIQKPTAGLQAEQISPNIPSKTDQMLLVKQSIYDFSISTKTNSMEHFYTAISQIWQKQTSANKLDEIFKAYFTPDLDLTELNTVQPFIEPVNGLDENQVLTIKGYYATEPSQARFTFKYIFEGVSWKLIGFHLEVS